MGEKIRQARENAGLTQKQLAEALGLDQSAVSNWETGKSEPVINNLRRLADILGCNPADLL
jgi:transcriptional regulator with XRE-family HTH domain